VVSCKYVLPTVSVLSTSKIQATARSGAVGDASKTGCIEVIEARLAACSLKSDSTEQSQLSALLVNSSNGVSAAVDVLPRSEEPTIADLFQMKDENALWPSGADIHDWVFSSHHRKHE